MIRENNTTAYLAISTRGHMFPHGCSDIMFVIADSFALQRKQWYRRWIFNTKTLVLNQLILILIYKLLTYTAHTYIHT